jgi:hypothetical protein
MTSQQVRLPAGLLVAAIVGVAWWIGDGLGSVAYLAYYVAVTLPGWPLGWALFGRRQAAGWIAGALLGYALTTIAWWVPVVLGVPSRTSFALAWVLLVLLVWITQRGRNTPLVRLPAWGRRETTALMLVLVLVPALVAVPFHNLGRRDESGTRYYRAYFIADFVWHAALTAELSKLEWPPRNPYLASQPVHYYWTYMLVPAVASARGPSSLRNVQQALKVNALASGLLFFGAIFVAAWMAVPRAWAVAVAVALTVTASSAEGAYAVWDLLARGHPLSELRDLNIDAISTWFFQGLRVDGLQRALWYTPQHSMAGALGLVALGVAASAGANASIGAIALAGLALGASTAFNPFVGGVFSLGYGLAVLAGVVARRERPTLILRHAVAAVPVMLALGWVRLAGMVADAMGVLHFGYMGPATHAPVLSLLLSLGPMLVLAVLGIWPRRSLPFLALAPAVATAGLGLFFAYTLVLVPDQFWVGFRATQIVEIVAPALIAHFLASEGRSTRTRALVAGAGTACLLAGLPTTLVDGFNAQDIAYRAMGPGFRWTLPVTPDQQAAFAWIRRYTPMDAVVSMEPTVRGRDGWSLIPTFAERRMPAGVAIALLSTPEADQALALVRRLYETPDAREAWELAGRLHIDYVYLDETERKRYPGAPSDKFGLHPEYFTPVFHNRRTAVFAVRKATSGPSEAR